jgi:hypothetical protein
LLNSNNILRGGLQVENDTNVCNEDLEDVRTSSIVSTRAMATKENRVVGDDILPANPTSPLHTQHHVQFGANKAAVPYNVLLCAMDGIHVEGNIPIMGMVCINAHDASHVGLLEVVVHPMASTPNRAIV